MVLGYAWIAIIVISIILILVSFYIFIMNSIIVKPRGSVPHFLGSVSSHIRGSVPLIQNLPTIGELQKHIYHDHKPDAYIGSVSTIPLSNSYMGNVGCGKSFDKLPDYMVLSNDDGGHTNQILTLMQQASVAEQCGIPVVFGNYTERQGYDKGYHDAKFVGIPLDSVFMFDKNIPFLNSRIIKRPISLPVPQCIVHLRLINLEDFNCLTIPNGGRVEAYSDTFKLPFHKMVGFLAGIKIASHRVLSRCARAKEQLKSYTCWHPRNEKDWGQSYNLSKVDFIYTNKYIISGVRKDHWTGKSFFKRDFNVENFSSTEKLLFDFCVCEQADRFVGVLLSTLSYHIWIVRLTKNRLSNVLVSNSGIFWSSTMHEKFISGIPGYFNLYLSEQIMVL